MTFFAGLKGSAGYQYFPTGMLLQWGTVGLKSAPSGTSIGTFPVAFPAAGQQIVVTHDNPLTNVMAFGAASIIDPTQFRVNAIAIMLTHSRWHRDITSPCAGSLLGVNNDN
jgi:hypothetical protein